MEWFEQIRKNLIERDGSWQEIQVTTDQIFQAVYQYGCLQDANFTLDQCKAFLANKKHTVLEVLGEWCRLWNSYLPGLFKYTQFPGNFKTNNLLEHAFSVEKQALITRVGKGVVSHMIHTRGEDYLRLTHCEKEELTADWEIDVTNELLQNLRNNLQKDIHG